MYNKVSRLISHVYAISSSFSTIPLRYYAKEPNVGDLLNPYMIKRITGKNTFHCVSHKFKHLTAIGSLLETVGPNSMIWGTGSINGAGPSRKISRSNIYALRGQRTKVLLEGFLGEKIMVPLGDPALLMPKIFNPDVKKEFDVGIVPHHLEKDKMRKILKCSDINISVIDVSLDPESFVKEIKKCDVIFSSSLHGLILSDAYEIPSSWISLSDRLISGQWKFLDYYSMTSNQEATPRIIEDVDHLRRITADLKRSSNISHYKGSLDSLLASFPPLFSDSGRAL